MSEVEDDGDEVWFKEIYGTKYQGPRLVAGATQGGLESALPKAALKHAPNSSDSEDDQPRDPNAVPTDFTSREAKVWEAKAKAVERNWKRRKEEEFTCRLCGEVGHFAQGCPTTLGGKRKCGEVVEAIPLRDKRLKPRLIGTGGVVVQGIEKETGCRLKLEDNLDVGNGSFFVKITGPDKVKVKKAMACVNTLVNRVEDEWKQQAGARNSKERERERAGEGSVEGGTNASANVVVFSQTQLISARRHRHENNILGGPDRKGDLTISPLDEEKGTIERIASQLEARGHCKALSVSSQQSLSGSLKEGKSCP